MTIETKTRAEPQAASARRKLAAALAEAQLALARHDALAMIDGIFARGRTYAAELHVLKDLLPPESCAYRLAEDAAGCAMHVAGGGKGDVFAILHSVSRELRASEAAGQPRTA